MMDMVIGHSFTELFLSNLEISKHTTSVSQSVSDPQIIKFNFQFTALEFNPGRRGRYESGSTWAVGEEENRICLVVASFTDCQDF